MKKLLLGLFFYFPLLNAMKGDVHKPIRQQKLEMIQAIVSKEGIALNLLEDGVGITDSQGCDVLELMVKKNLSYPTSILLELGIGNVQKAYDSRTALEQLRTWCHLLWDADYRLTYYEINRMLEDKLRTKASESDYCKTSYHPRNDLAVMYRKTQEQHRHTD